MERTLKNLYSRVRAFGESWGSGRVRDMWQIYLMWRMIKIVRKDEKVWATANLRLKAAQKLNAEYGKSPYFKEIIDSEVSSEITRNKDTLWILKNGPVNSYTLKYNKKLRVKEKNAVGYNDGDGKATQWARQETKSILDNCLAYNFLERNPSNEEELRLTTKGKIFSTLTGLLLELQKLTKPIYVALAILIAWIVRELIPLILKLR